MIVHNYYQKTGGEDQVFAAESDLLEAHGQQVLRYTVHNEPGVLQRKLSLARKTVWNQTRYRELRRLFKKQKPNVVHVHNTMPLISPAIYYAAQAAEIPVCQTLHNYRLLCPNACFFRDDTVCEDCIGWFLAWPGVLHACYRGSVLATMVVSFMNFFHRLMGTWKNKVDVYIAPSEFSKQKFIQAGLSEKKIVVKPNFVECVSNGSVSEVGKQKEGSLFVGRLSREKGVETLLKAWKIVGNIMPLKIVGDGPLAPAVQKNASENYGISWLGLKPIQAVYKLMAKAEVLVFPSECYEGMPRTIIEGFAQGTPLISSRLGAMAEIIEHGRTGLLFEPGNAQNLAKKILWANKHPDEMASMGRNARSEYYAKYTSEKNYNMLMNIYEHAIENHARQQHRK
jgi:glycosyltransferase involved in cell wall biosynthesis